MLDIRSNPPAGPERGPASELRICLLGTFECRRGGTVIPRETWRTRPTLSLFKVLLDQRDQPVPVDRLIDTVWPDSEPGAARQSLQVAVRTIRLALEPDLKRGTDSRFVKTVPGAYLFDASGCTIDIELFLAASQRALTGRRRDIALTITHCHEAIALYRGEYLADDPYSEWTFSTRERLRSRYLEVLDLLSASLAESGEWEQAVEWVERALDRDPLREDLYRRLMRCHAARGRRSHVLAAFERCRSVLQRDLAVEPSVETLDLYAELSTSQRSTGPSRTAPEPAAPGRSVDLRVPFAGRSREMAILSRAAERARSDAGILVAVAGPPGVGKSRLVEEFSQNAGNLQKPDGEPAMTAVWLHCHEVERSVPFAPLARQLASWFERTPSMADRRRLEPFAPALARLVPQARAGLAADRDVVGSFEVGQLLEAATQAVRLMFQGGPGLLVIDDLQWADASTLLWLSYVLHRFDPGVLTVVTYRAAEAATPEVGQLLAETRRDGKLIDLALGPLAPGAVEDLVGAVAVDAEQRADLTRNLYQRTGGLPLYIVETLRDFVASGRLFVDDQGRWRADPAGLIEVPGDALREIILARVSVLDPDVLQAFEALCVIGAECNARLIASSSGASIESTLAGLDRLLEHDLIRVGRGGRSYVVEHPVVREVIYEDLGAARQQAWHLRVAGAIRDLGDELPISTSQALHHLIAGDAPAHEIVEAAEVAGERAMQQSAIPDAIECFEVAIHRLRDLQPSASVTSGRIRISERRADALAAGGRWDAAIESYESLLAIAGQPLDRARVMRKLASVLGDVRGQFDRALQVLDTAERELDALTDDGDRGATAAEFGRIEGARSNAYFFQSEYRRAIDHGERALRHWAGLPGLDRDVTEQIVRIGNAAQRLGMLDLAGQQYRAAAARAEIVGDRVLEARCRDVLAGLWTVQGRLKEAEVIHRQTAATGRELGVPRLEIVGLANVAVDLCSRGLLGAARDTYEQVLGRARELDAQYTVMHVLVGLGEVLVRMGEFDLARETLEHGIGLAEEINSTQRRGHAYLHLAELALLEGDFSGALEWSERGIATGTEIHDLHSRREGLPLNASALTGIGKLDDAIDTARRGLEISSSAGFRLSEVRNLLALGEALAASGRNQDAEAAFSDAERIAREIDAGYDLARVLRARACHSSDADQRSEWLDEARALADAAPSRPLVERIEELLQT